MRQPGDSMVRARSLALVGALLVASAPAAALAQASAQPSAQAAAQAAANPAANRAAVRDASLRALADRLDLPLVEESVAIFSKQLRRTLPTYFVESVGRQADLGPQWRRGNATFDESLRRVDAALAAEEARGGPLLKLEHGDLLLEVNIPWTQDDIAFVTDTLDSELGRQADRALDAKAALQITQTLKRRIAKGAGGEGLAAAFADLEARANAQFGDAVLMLLPLRASDPVRTERLQRLIASVTTAPSDALGARVVDRLSARLIDAATAQLPGVLADIVHFEAPR